MSKEENIIGYIEGFAVTFSIYSKEFTAKKDDKKINAPTWEKLEELVKRQVANDRHFVPIQVIQVGADRVGRITSRVTDKDAQVYFTYKNKPNEKASRVAESLEPYSWTSKDQKFNFVEATPANLAKLEAIQKLDDEIRVLHEQQERLRASYDSPITWDLINSKSKQGGTVA